MGVGGGVRGPGWRGEAEGGGVESFFFFFYVWVSEPKFCSQTNPLFGVVELKYSDKTPPSFGGH